VPLSYAFPVNISANAGSPLTLPSPLGLNGFDDHSGWGEAMPMNTFANSHTASNRQWFGAEFREQAVPRAFDEVGVMRQFHRGRPHMLIARRQPLDQFAV